MKCYTIAATCYFLLSCSFSTANESVDAATGDDLTRGREEPTAATSPRHRSKRFFGGMSTITTGGASGTCRYDQYRNGTCISAVECATLGGKLKPGLCRDGRMPTLGQCCLLEDSCGDIQSGRNNTLFTNPEYPDYISEAQRCSLTVPVLGSCFIRLNFVNFTIHGPVDGSCVVDQFHVPELMHSAPMICGYNNNTHMYLDVRELKAITLRMNIGEWNGKRRWYIEILRYDCDVEWAPKPGCLQQLFLKTDIVKSFNYDDHNPDNSSLLAGLDYSICVRQAVDQCYIQWTADDFQLSDGNGTALIGDKCARDNYLLIEGGYDISDRKTTYDRFCGDRLSAVKKSNDSSNVYSASAPFHVRVRSSRTQKNSSRGFVLRYNQMLCFDPPVSGINFREQPHQGWLKRIGIW